MKKLTLIFVMLMATSLVKAQTVDSIPHHVLGNHSAFVETLMELSDGDLLGGILLADATPNSLSPLGYLLHKVGQVDKHGGTILEISDSLFIEYERLPWHFTVSNPQGSGNILAEIANDFDNGSCYLRIRHFDDNLIFDTVDIVIHLDDFLCNGSEPGLLLDPNGDLVGSYYDNNSSVRHFIRLGLDGTVKYRKSNDSMITEAGTVNGPVLFSQSPLKYGYWGSFHDASQNNVEFVNFYLLDSLFNVTNSYTLPRMSGTPDYVNYNASCIWTKFLGLDNGNFLVARSYNRPSSLSPHIEDDGVAVIKYDSCFNILARRKFLTEPYVQNSPYGAKPIDLAKSKDGYIYFAYLTNTGYNYGHYYGQVSVVKMDSDLNIVWQRYCLEPVGYNREPYGKMIVLKDNSVAVMGISTITTGGYLDYTEAFYVIVHDDYDGIQEQQGKVVRPYTYWPNPAQDELHLQYSPDVQPKQIELFDLQGRLVRSQSQGLESVNMQGLAPGQYLMKVALEDGKSFTDKVVKE